MIDRWSGMTFYAARVMSVRIGLQSDPQIGLLREA